MQRFFSTFPEGRPGAGLLLLRLALGAAAVSLGVLFLVRTTDPGALGCAAAVSAIAGGLALAAGLITPVAAAAEIIVGVAAATCHVSPLLPLWGGRPLAPWLFVAIALAILMLGPGAYSVDARLFGRREIVIPKAPRKR